MSTFIKDNRVRKAQSFLRLFAPNLMRDGISMDPLFVFNGGIVDIGTNSDFGAFYSISDPNFVDNPVARGANLGKNAAGNVMMFNISTADNTVVIGSDASMPLTNQGGWWLFTYYNGNFVASNWLLSFILQNPSTATYNVLLGARFYMDSEANLGGNSFHTTFLVQSNPTLQYAADSFVAAGAPASQAFQFSVSLSGFGPGGGIVISSPSLNLYMELGVKITAGSNKSGSKVNLNTG